MIPKTEETLFVYGTLRQGFCRHHVLKGAVFLGLARTTPDFCLKNCGEYPALIRADSSAAGRSIEGELYRIAPALWSQLDEVEGVDEGLYRREQITLQPPFAASPVTTYLYARSTHGLPDCGIRWEK